MSCQRMDVVCSFFFFSSRRRHTRLQGDWSSDVCSSDLAGAAWAGKEVNSFLLSDPRFELTCRVDEKTCASLEIRGAVYASRARIQAVFAPDFGVSVFHMPLAERRRHLLAIDWVSEASISRVWPHHIVVTVTERRP